MAGKRDVVDIQVTLMAKKKEPLLGVRTFRGLADGVGQYPVEYKTGGCSLLIAPLTPFLQECFDCPLPLPGGPENAHLMTRNRVRVRKTFPCLDCPAGTGVPDSR